MRRVSSGNFPLEETRHRIWNVIPKLCNVFVQYRFFIEKFIHTGLDGPRWLGGIVLLYFVHSCGKRHILQGLMFVCLLCFNLIPQESPPPHLVMLCHRGEILKETPQESHWIAGEKSKTFSYCGSTRVCDHALCLCSNAPHQWIESFAKSSKRNISDFIFF